jgi:hypothetical protein
MTDIEGPIAANPGGTEGGQAPQNRTGNDERLAPEAVTKPAGEGRGDHVERKQSSGERAHLLVGGVKLLLNQGLCAGQNVAVNVIEQVEGDEQQEGSRGRVEACAKWLGHDGQEVLNPQKRSDVSGISQSTRNRTMIAAQQNRRRRAPKVLKTR